MNATQRWLERQEELEAEKAAQAKPPFFLTLDDYLQHFPQEISENSRKFYGNKLFFATYEGQGCVPGGYYLVFLRTLAFPFFCEPEEFVVVINDGDDGYISKSFATRQEVNEEIGRLKLLAPFHFGDLVKGFGYENE